jgi:hypothetical protein
MWLRAKDRDMVVIPFCKAPMCMCNSYPTSPTQIDARLWNGWDPTMPAEQFSKYSTSMTALKKAEQRAQKNQKGSKKKQKGAKKKHNGGRKK